MTAEIEKAQKNAEAAVARLEAFISLPVQNERDQAGIIQAFEFTFETCWKLMQKVAMAEGLDAPSPRAAISAGFRMGPCEPESVWLKMLSDRNLTSRTYESDLAQAIFERVVNSHTTALRHAIDACRKLMQTLLAARPPSGKTVARAVSVSFTTDSLVVHLDDEQVITASLHRFPALQNAAQAQRLNWMLTEGGLGIHWPDIDEDLSIRGLVILPRSQ